VCVCVCVCVFVAFRAGERESNVGAVVDVV
jgi:hypothetical protein